MYMLFFSGFAGCFGLIHVTYQFATAYSCIQTWSLFAFLSKAAPKCRCFSLAQSFLWWWGSQRKIVGVGNTLLLLRDWLCVLSLIGTQLHCKIYGESSKIQAPWVLPQSYIRSAHPRKLKVIGHRSNCGKSPYIYSIIDWTGHVNIIFPKPQLESYMQQSSS